MTTIQSTLVINPNFQDYARRPIAEAFDWPEIWAEATRVRGHDGDAPLYLVVFRSQLAPDADRVVVAHHDHHAHEAAKRSPALLHYFGGAPDAEGWAVSFCLWTGRLEARAAVSEPEHRSATQITHHAYASYALERYYVVKSTAGDIWLVPLDETPLKPILQP